MHRGKIAAFREELVIRLPGNQRRFHFRNVYRHLSVRIFSFVFMEKTQFEVITKTEGLNFCSR